MIGISMSRRRADAKIRAFGKIDAVGPRCNAATTADKDMRQLRGMVNGRLTEGRAITAPDARIFAVLLVISRSAGSGRGINGMIGSRRSPRSRRPEHCRLNRFSSESGQGEGQILL